MAASIHFSSNGGTYFALAGLAFVGSIVLWMIAVTYHFYETHRLESNSAWAFAAVATVLFVASVVLSVIGAVHVNSTIFGNN